MLTESRGVPGIKIRAFPQSNRQRAKCVLVLQKPLSAADDNSWSEYEVRVHSALHVLDAFAWTIFLIY